MLYSQAVLIGNRNLDESKLADLKKLQFRFSSNIDSRDMKYVLMNLPAASVDKAVAMLPGMKSPTLLPLAEEGWFSLHAVIAKDELWEKVEMLKSVGAEDILVLQVENIIR